MKGGVRVLGTPVQDAGGSELVQCWASRLDNRRNSFVKAQA